MSKALTVRDRKFKGDIDPGAPGSRTEKREAYFPSYFCNFGIFNRFLMFPMGAAFTKRRLPKKDGFPLITAIMAIV
jgi:hypothetical protein